jgi:hypothetical protein
VPASAQKSIQTVDELLAIDNDNALRKAQSRRFGEPPIPGSGSGQGVPALVPMPSTAPGSLAASLPKAAPRVDVLAIYGTTGNLRADLQAADQTVEGVRVGSVVAGCTVAAITAQRVEFASAKDRAKCQGAAWTGESPKAALPVAAQPSAGSMVNGVMTYQVPPLQPLK